MQVTKTGDLFGVDSGNLIDGEHVLSLTGTGGLYITTPESGTKEGSVQPLPQPTVSDIDAEGVSVQVLAGQSGLQQSHLVTSAQQPHQSPSSAGLSLLVRLFIFRMHWQPL